MRDGEKIDRDAALALIAAEPCRMEGGGDPPHWCQRSLPMAEWCPSCLANAALHGVKLPKISPLTSREVTDDEYEADVRELTRQWRLEDEATTSEPSA